MNNSIDRYAGIHILSAEKVKQSFIEKTGELKSSFNVFLPRAFVGALCFKKNMTWQCYFFDDIHKEDYIQDTIESVVDLFAQDPAYKCCLFLVNEDTIDKVVRSTKQMLALQHLNVSCIVQDKETTAVLRQRVEKYTGDPLRSRYGMHQFVFRYIVYVDDDTPYGDPQTHILIEDAQFSPVWSFIDNEVFKAALRHEIVSEGRDEKYKDPPHYR
jgi:hypothetical protein